MAVTVNTSVSGGGSVGSGFSSGISNYFFSLNDQPARTTLDALIDLNKPVLQPLPAREIPYATTTTIYYVDPTGANGTGTFASPFNNAPSAFAVAARGGAVLFKEGTTTTIAAAMIPPATSGVLPFVIGVYEASTGSRVVDKLGAATINCNAAAIDAITVDNRNYVCVENLNFLNNGTGNWLVNFSGTSAFGKMLNCRFTGGGYHAVFQTSGDNNVIEGCYSSGATQAGLYFYIGANIANSSLKYNFVKTALNSLGVVELTSGPNAIVAGTVTFSGTIAGNVVQDNADLSDYRAGIEVAVGGGSPKIFGNNVTRCTRGIALSGTQAARSNFANSFIENNECTFNEFGIALSKVNGPLNIWYNLLSNNGSKNGTTAVTANAYGRAIELYGLTATTGVFNVTVAYNVCNNTYQWSTAAFPGTEGVGVGLDNNTIACKVFGNICSNNEGHGIQANVGSMNLIYSNLLINNNIVPESKGINWGVLPNEAQSQLLYIQNPGISVFNNTVLCANGLRQRFGISESLASPSANSSVFNNVILNTTDAGMFLNIAVNFTTEKHNKVIAPTVIKNTLNTVIGAGTNSSLISSADYTVTSSFVIPQKGGALDGTGFEVAPALSSITGQSLSIRTPIGSAQARV